MKEAKDKVRVWFITAPRWFGLPIALCSVILGGILVKLPLPSMILISLTGALLMAGLHSMNSYLDWAVTKFDQGTIEERSRKKEYTTGQNFIEEGKLSPNATLACSLFWIAVSVIPIIFIGQPLVWLPWGLGIVSGIGYSFAKKCWCPEIALGFAFATCATWLGMASSGHIDFWRGFLISLPFFVIWGGLAEHIDQWKDWGSDWPKGGRSAGMLVGKLNIPLRWSVAWAMTIVYLVQIFLISIDLLAPATGLTFLAVIPMSACGILIDTELKKGVLWGLSGVYLYEILLVVGQAIG